MNIQQRTTFVKKRAKELGFLNCGISKAEFLEEEAPRFEAWLKKGFHGELGYMENHFDKRLDPTKLVPGAKSVISFSFNYYTENQQPEDSYKISKYAYGKDYHFVVKDKLFQLFNELQDEIGEINGRVFVDSAPVLDRAWAKRSGLGWVGKNSNILAKGTGSFFFLAEIISDVEFEYDSPFKTDHCGSCTACIDACPTQAIEAPRMVNASKCISYATIELKNEIPAHFQDRMEDWMFGCDICQDVCPWNRFSKPHQEREFEPHPAIQSFKKKEWEELSQEMFNEIFRKSAVKRTKYTGLMRNMKFIKP
ncbi:tRNA epoxyqueuosine(34) reductase QueG [Candidatus Ornithobacterium hominis]|uniref:tRNA epoxyqueuosine(34) reductase QueG n=1 Tax=Candidatus Ornithobacterium hominis TaxID=2497989 RepID=UPI0024BD30C1|nr:tRNA epoxyqueuosine(34) reductase QueG [Candidatus Ornithobacterium hominis]CAI9428753.1 tRNA epoxyqueuosine(34) reductase QueG [Candidatus Ornithobacterium hominis]